MSTATSEKVPPPLPSTPRSHFVEVPSRVKISALCQGKPTENFFSPPERNLFTITTNTFKF